MISVCMLVLATALAATAQISKQPIRLLPEVTLAEAADIDQCANGPQDAQVPCTGTAWQNGNLNQNQAHYLEGESVPYRLRITGLRALSTGNTVTIEWDTTVESGNHALDYLTSYNRSETDADPCTGVVGCNPVLAPDTYPIPIDPRVTAGNDGVIGTADDIVQEPGVFSLFGGTITDVSGYTVTGDYTGASETSITITFTANTPNVVLAWGGHISTRYDWGWDHSAIAISGSPYHMRLIDLNGSGGNQDRSLSNSAAVFPGRLTIIKDAEPNTITPFLFYGTGPEVTDFFLDDDGYPEINYPNTKTFAPITYFGAGDNLRTIREYAGEYFTIADILCTSAANGGAGTNNNTVDLDTLSVEIVIEEGEYVTCTFVNAVTGPTAADVTIAGRVTDKGGEVAIANVILQLVPIRGEEVYTARTNGFGYYSFEGIPSGEAYVLTIVRKGYTFGPPSMFLNVDDNIQGLDFIAFRDP